MGLAVVAQPCDHRPEPHVVYDKPGSGYRGMLRCRCHKVMRVSRKLRDKHAEAEADAREMLVVKKRTPERNAEGAGSRVGTKAGPSGAAPSIPRGTKPAPTPEQVTDMWRRYWRRKLAERGHESRL